MKSVYKKRPLPGVDFALKFVICLWFQMILSDFVVEINKWKDYCGVIGTSLYANWDQSIYLNHVKKRKKKISIQNA